MDIWIRHAENRDCQTIVDFIRATLTDMESVGGYEINPNGEFWQWYAGEVTGFIQKEDRLYLLAQAGSSVSGFLEGKIIRTHEMVTRMSCFHISLIYVNPECRRRGVGTALVQKALQWASGQGCREADLDVLFDNNKAKSLYKKLGFQVFQQKLRMNLPPNI
jgi:ribosomal protein S18 acetylase RimI-like enzyme